jgi:transcriptional regulator with XRE-family HTH domain
MARLQLVTSNGKRVDKSGDGSPTFHGQISESELTLAQRLDLPGAPLGEFPAPHAHRFSGDAERIGEGLMGTTEVGDNFIKRNLGRSHCPSVSVLPVGVKPLTRERQTQVRKLAYMSKRKPKDSWAIQRGAAMRAARVALGKSQAEIAELAGVRDRETISQYESGLIADIDSGVIPKLATALGMPPQQLSRTPWDARDEAADLRVSSVARQIAYSFDRYPLAIQNQIREAIARYEIMVKQHGKEAADALFGPPPSPQKAEPPPLKRQAQR